MIEIAFYFIAACLLARVLNLPPFVQEARHLTHAQDIDTTYDYVIVGGKTAGLTAAVKVTGNERGPYSIIDPTTPAQLSLPVIAPDLRDSLAAD
ncbi:hypothetical protein BJ878DRAFT_539597 [Calycina marina]|uniref:Uncharacterized protein n=1 Tax=Calycina marina TaxID=1763456 RepID=A0A9P8CHQ4_9HELO|nr:hypothetical protein BJ878DRAFT_539597 [Calycina marina]